ncbi:hypothetical protein J7M23_10195 [Candidatus Sumerlaeota bacterium]|nr:hypothetical protein [Candidatus Sumerlaeota bacterium]
MNRNDKKILVSGYMVLFLLTVVLFQKGVLELLTRDTPFSQLPAHLVGLAFIPFLYLIPFLLEYLFRVLSFQSRLKNVLAFSISILALIIVRVFPGVIFIISILIILLFFLILFLGLRRGVYLNRVCLTVSLFFIIMGGFILRWMAFLQKAGRILDPDAEGFYHLVLHTRTFFTATMSDPPFAREPMFIWLCKLWFVFLPATRMSLRLLTVILSTLLILVLFYVARIIFKRLFSISVAGNLALITALITALNPQLIFMSNRGLRFELYLFLFLMFLYFALHCKSSLTFIECIGLGGIGGLLCLTRASSPSLLIPVLFVIALKDKWLWWKPILIILISLFILTPHLIANYLYTPGHDPFFTTNIHARFYRNLEFKDQPGFPSSEDVSQNAWAGEEISVLEYLFSLHTPQQLLKGSLRGIKRLFLTTYAQMSLFNSRLLVVLYLLGFLYLIFRGQWHIPAIMVGIGLPFIYLAGIGIDWRLVGILTPFFFICVTAFFALLREVFLIYYVHGSSRLFVVH